MYSATDPSLVTRVAFLAATETPFLRRTTTAASKSPLASVRACLQSIMGAPVFSRSSLTCAAEIFTVVALILAEIPSYKLRPAPDDPRGSGCVSNFGKQNLVRLRFNFRNDIIFRRYFLAAGSGSQHFFHADFLSAVVDGVLCRSLARSIGLLCRSL